MINLILILHKNYDISKIGDGIGDGLVTVAGYNTNKLISRGQC